MAPSEQTKTEEQKLGMLPNAAGEWPIVPMPPRSENPGVGGSIPSLPTIFMLFQGGSTPAFVGRGNESSAAVRYIDLTKRLAYRPGQSITL